MQIARLPFGSMSVDHTDIPRKSYLVIHKEDRSNPEKRLDHAGRTAPHPMTRAKTLQIFPERATVDHEVGIGGGLCVQRIYGGKLSSRSFYSGQQVSWTHCVVFVVSPDGLKKKISLGFFRSRGFVLKKS